MVSEKVPWGLTRPVSASDRPCIGSTFTGGRTALGRSPIGRTGRVARAGSLQLLEDLEKILKLALGVVAKLAELRVDIVAGDHHRRGDDQSRAGGPERQTDVGGQGVGVNLLGAADPAKRADHTGDGAEQPEQRSHTHDGRDRRQAVLHPRDDLRMEFHHEDLFNLGDPFLPILQRHSDELGQGGVPVRGTLTDSNGGIKFALLGEFAHLLEQRTGILQRFFPKNAVEQDCIVDAPDRQQGQGCVDNVSEGVDDFRDLESMVGAEGASIVVMDRRGLARWGDVRNCLGGGGRASQTAPPTRYLLCRGRSLSRKGMSDGSNALPADLPARDNVGGVGVSDGRNLRTSPESLPMPRTVLIVDDERDTNDILASLVRARGFEPIQLFTGAQVCPAVREHAPDVILLDLMLPDMNGFDICDELKRDRATNLIPIIMVTALHDANHRAAGVRVGANGYLTKPFTPVRLYQAIDDALGWRKEHEESGIEGEINFDVRSELTYLQQANDMLADLFLRTPLTERQIKDLRQAIMEMGGNAIEWGHRKNADLVLRITYRIDPTAVTLVIQDQGPGFNPKTLPHAASDEDPIGHLDIRNELGIREGGFGIMLARGLVDAFAYNAKGNEVTLVKRFEGEGRGLSSSGEAVVKGESCRTSSF